MTANRPRAGHPWRSKIREHVAESYIRRRIAELEDSIKASRLEIKALKGKLSDQCTGAKS